MKRAVIVGSNGQDGQLLFRFLSKKGYQLLGVSRTSVQAVGLDWNRPLDIHRAESVSEMIRLFRPDEIYYLAAVHRSSEENEIENEKSFQDSYAVHVFALIHFLEGIRKCSSPTRLFYGASSHIFGESAAGLQDEATPIHPNCIYGITKAAGLLTCRFYRERYSIFASAGILYNHESSLRSERFVSMKIIKGAINIKNRKQAKLIVGNLEGEVDWGYAPDYVDAMVRLLKLPISGEFVIATGKAHTVRDFVKTTFEALGLNWTEHVEEDPTLITKKESHRVGNPAKLMAMTAWRPSVGFEEMIRILIQEQGGFE